MSTPNPHTCDMLNTLTTPERVVRTARVQSNGIAASWHCSVFGGVRRKRYKICSFRISWFEFIAFETKWRRSDAHLSDDKATNIPPRLRRRHRPRCWRNAIVCGAIAAIGEQDGCSAMAQIRRRCRRMPLVLVDYAHAQIRSYQTAAKTRH